jgi:hypothetical protein
MIMYQDLGVIMKRAMLVVFAILCAGLVAMPGCGDDDDGGGDSDSDSDTDSSTDTDSDSDTDTDTDTDADDGSLLWAKRAGGSGDDRPTDIELLEDGTILVTGVFEGAATFGPEEENETTLVSAADRDVFFALYEPDGALIRADRAQSGETGDWGTKTISGLDDGGFLAWGDFSGSIVFDPEGASETTVSSPADYNVFMAHYDAGGDVVGAKRLVHTSAADTDTDTDTDTGSDSDSDSDTDGEVIGRLNTHYFDGASSADGSFWLAGTFEGSARFDGAIDLASGGDQDAYFARFDATGQIVTARRATNAWDAHGTGVAALPDGSAIAVGESGLDTVLVGEGEPNETTLDPGLFLIGFAPDGSVVWATGAALEWCEGSLSLGGIASLADGTTFISGVLVGGPDSITFGEGEENVTIFDNEGSTAFTARYSADGILEWAEKATSTFLEGIRVGGIAGAPDGSVVIAGHFSGEALFAEGEPNETLLEMDTTSGDWPFIAKYGPDGALVWARSVALLEEGRGHSAGVVLDSDGNAIVTGDFTETATFGLGETTETSLESASMADVFVAKYSL